MLDIEECERARVRRDRRFDGLFFSGVRTTCIYCRPVCPVRPAKAASVMFYPSVAPAELAVSDRV
jgi:AraC family transcriptional regulator, regulatory protein of adaptative response / methylated-DNA-[protein]-cysteine methyltransferase